MPPKLIYGGAEIEMFNHGFQTVCVLLFCLLLSGCGGGGKSSGGSLTDQYQKAMQTADPTARVTNLLRVAQKQDAAGDFMGTEQTLASAAAAGKGIDDAEGRAAALNRVASAMARMDQPAEAKNLLKEVRKASDEIDDPESKVSTLTRMAYTHGKYLDDKDVAAIHLKNCEDIAGSVTRPEGKVESMLAVAYVYFGLSETDKMQSLIDQSLEAARALEDTRKRADSIANAAAYLSKMKKSDDAKAAFEEAHQGAEKIEDPLSQAHALVHLGEKLKESNLKAAAQKILLQAEEAADKVKDQSMRVPLMEKIYAARRR